MKLRTISRLAGALSAVCLVAGVVTTVLSPAAAMDQDRIVLGPDQKVVKDYSPLIGNNPGANVDASTTVSTDICATPNTTCDVIPLTVQDPGTDDDFFVRITLTWDTEEIHNVPLFGDFDVNDLDLWIVDDPFNEDAGPDEDGFHYKSAGTSMPEFVQMFRPIGKFNLIIVNASGINTGYRLTFEWSTDKLPTIFESLPPEFSAPVRPAPVAPAAPAAAPVAPAAPSPEVAPAPSPAPTTAAAPDLTAGASFTPDTSFASGFGDAATLDSQLASPKVAEFKPAAVERIPPPSTASVILWLLALPLFLLALAAGLLSRRRSALIQI